MEKVNSKAYGRAFKIVRVANNYSTKKVAELAQISSTYISEVESGNKTLSLEKFKEVSKIYNISASQMMELIEYYESLEELGERELMKYQLTLIKALKMLLNED